MDQQATHPRLWETWDLETAAAALPGDTSILWTHLGTKTWVKKREQECLGREIPTWLFILLHKNCFCCHDMKEYWILLKTNQWSQPALVHVASMQFSHGFLTFSKHSISPATQKDCRLYWLGMASHRHLQESAQVSFAKEEHRPLEVPELTASHCLNKNCFQGSVTVP